MAINYWWGSAQSVQQVDAYTVGAPVAGSIYSVKINGKTISFSATTTVAGDAATGLAAALVASQEPEFREVTWSVNGAVLTGTGPTDGTPFTAAYVASGTGAPTFTGSTTTAGSGPNYYNVAGNWSLNAVPVATNDVVVDTSTVPILYGLNNAAVALNSFSSGPSFNAGIGLPETNKAGYREYRQTHLGIQAPTMTINSPSGSIKIDAGTTQTLLNIVKTGSATNPGEPVAVDFKGTNANNVVNITSGTVGLAALAGEVATVLTLRIGAGPANSGGPTVVGGPLLTLGTLIQDGGTASLQAGLTTCTKSAGSLTVIGTGACTTMTNYAGLLSWQSSGTITTLVEGPASINDFASDPRPRTVTNLTRYKGAQHLDDFHTVTMTNGMIQPDGDISDGRVTFGIGRTITVA